MPYPEEPRPRKGRGLFATPEERPIKRYSKRPVCTREGCTGTISKPKSQHCSFICSAIDRQLDQAQRICTALGPDIALAAELYAEVVALNDTFTRVREIDSKLFQHAESVGFTREQWRSVKAEAPPPGIPSRPRPGPVGYAVVTADAT